MERTDHSEVLARMMHKFSTAPTKSSGVLHRPCDPQAAGAPDSQAGATGLLNVPYSTFVGASVARRATPSGRRAFVSLRYKNLCIIRASDSKIK